MHIWGSVLVKINTRTKVNDDCHLQSLFPKFIMCQQNAFMHQTFWMLNDKHFSSLCHILRRQEARIFTIAIIQFTQENINLNAVSIWIDWMKYQKLPKLHCFNIEVIPKWFSYILKHFKYFRALWLNYHFNMNWVRLTDKIWIQSHAKFIEFDSGKRSECVRLTENMMINETNRKRNSCVRSSFFVQKINLSIWIGWLFMFANQ